jgi:uncharacterized repeat protein (TIGR03806 family)
MTRSLLSAVACCSFAIAAISAEPVRKPTGIEQRELWTTGNIHGSPEPPDPYRAEDAFPRLKFMEPISVALIPGQNRFAVATRPGRIHTFDIRPDVERTNLLLELNRTVYGLALHPKFAENGYFFVTSLIKDAKPEAGSRLSRFRVKQKDPPQADATSEQTILEWPTGGHNGGCIRFGPDGYLYLSCGDGSGIADELQTGQKIDDLVGSILRINVDQPSGEKLYSIPADNPFANHPTARPEIWSLGHRQIWKFSFDPPTGRMWAGEVGQDLWEMIYLIRRGGNYGWSVQEGSHPFRPDRPRGPGEFEKPIIEQPHSDFRSITGGYVYRANRLPELKDAYIYGDYDTGRVWLLRYDGPADGRGGKVVEHRQLATTQIRLVEFAQDNAGEVYLVDFAGGAISRLAPTPAPSSTSQFPRKLSETGLFASTKDHTPAKGLIPYSVNAQLWSDGAEKVRFLALPGDSQIEMDAVVYPHGPTYPDRGWRFPDGAVLVKTFSLPMRDGDPVSARRLETRILQHRKMPGNDDEYGAQYWYGYTYLWNDEQSDADLLGPAGLDREYTVKDDSAAGGSRLVKWHFPSRAECTLCHTMAAKYILGVTTMQMNKDHDYGGVVANQLGTLDHLKIFKSSLPKPPDELPRLADYRDATQDRHLRARAYIHANCAHCHRKWGGGNAEFDIQASFPLTETKSINTPPGQGALGLSDPRVIVPGDPSRSLLLHRMQLTTLGRMPHIASNIVDRAAVDLLRDWINELSDEKLLTKPGAINPRLSDGAQ